MNFKPIKSSRIKKIAYLDDEDTMVIVFNDDRMYEYYDVPKAVYNELLYSKSPGTYFGTKIKGIYHYERA